MITGAINVQSECLDSLQAEIEGLLDLGLSVEEINCPDLCGRRS